MILKNDQLLFTDGWLEKTKAKIITTGNELSANKMIDFSKQLDIKATYDYCKAVMNSTNELLKNLKFADLKKKFTEEDKNRLIKTKSVSSSESAAWLIDYWCSKNIKGIIQMPFSRHWIMHVEAMNRIKDKLKQQGKNKWIL